MEHGPTSSLPGGETTAVESVHMLAGMGVGAELGSLTALGRGLYEPCCNPHTKGDASVTHTLGL